MYPWDSPLDLGGLVDRSLRHLGQLLVVMGALLGAALGVGLALIVENADTNGAVALGRERAAVLTASPPPTSRGASSEDSTPGDGASGSQRAEAADQADQRDRKADKNQRHDKPGKGSDKPGENKKQ
jgi:hypothetical protein